MLPLFYGIARKNKKMNESKYKTTFAGIVKEVSPIGEGGFKLSEASKQRISQASASLKKLSYDLPYIDFSKNYDLQGIVCNAAVINKFNDNDDGISAHTAIKSCHWYSHKPINIEHERKDVVGHIINHSFHEYGTNDPLWSWDMDADNADPFYLSLAGVIYKMSFPEVAQLLDDAATEENEFLYKMISASWEVGFEKYNIAIGSSNELKKCKIITKENDAELFATLDPKLKANGGSGTHNDQRVYRLITGEITPLGIGLTTNPAADVQGVLTYDASYWGSSDEEVYAKNNKKNQEKISQTAKSSVLNKNNCINTMNEESKIIEVLEKILGDKLAKEKISKEAVASVVDPIKDAILVKNEEFAKEKEELTKERDTLANKEKQAQEDLAKATQDISELQTKLNQAQEELKKLSDERAVEQANSTFSSRMEVLDNIYELDDQDRKVLATDLKALDLTDEAFAAFQEKLEVTFKHKNKEYIKAQEEEIQAKIDARVKEELEKRKNGEETSTASNKGEETEDEVDNAVDNATATNSEPANSNSETNETKKTLVERFKDLNKDDLVEVNV